jgi:hypothetical protein
MANGIGEVGRQLTETEKVQARYGLLMQATGKTQGDFANTSDGLANQLRILTAEVSNTEIEIGNQLLPVMAELLPIVRDLVRDLGTQLVAAVKAVDWKALTTDLMNTLGFFIRNATAIAQLTVAVFAINTAFKAFQVISGIVSVALSVKTWWLAKTATGMTNAAVATGIFSTALKTIPFVAIAAGIGLIIAGITEADSSYRTTTPVVTSFGQEVLKTGHDAEWAAGKYGTATTAVKNFSSAISSMPTIPKIDIPVVGGGRGLDLPPSVSGVVPPSIPVPSLVSGGGGSSGRGSSPLQDLLADPARNIRADKQAVKLEGAGLAKEVAQWITSVQKPVVVARKVLKSIDKNGATAIANITRDYKNSTTGRAAAAAAAAQADSDAIASANALRDAQAAAAAAEAAAIAERERVYKSFADSVKNTFAGIKSSILGAFDLTQLGGSTNAITRNMEKLLTRLRSFATNVKSLASMGLNPALLQQIISAGPMAGARLAEGLVMGGAGGLSAINAGYSEFGALSGQIAQTGTESLFNREAQQTVYNINVDGGVGSGSTIGKAIVDAIKAYERTSGAVWQGA